MLWRTRLVILGVALWLGCLGPLSSLRAKAEPAQGRETATADAKEQSERDREARASFEAGRAALEEGRFDEALHLFEAAYDLSGRPELLFNIGTVLDRLRRDAEAARYFENYLSSVPAADNRRAVEARLEVLHERLGLEPEKPLAPAPREVARSAPDANAPVPAVPSPVHQERPRRKWWLWTSVGVIVAGGVTAAVMLSRKDDTALQEPVLGSQGAFAQALRAR